MDHAFKVIGKIINGVDKAPYLLMMNKNIKVNKKCVIS
jgi:hypothetical protein